MAEGGSKQIPALEELKSKGVQIHRWPDEFLATLQSKWEEVLAEKSAEDPLFKRIAESYTAFRKNYKLWSTMQKMN
jgi:TRAP-type mannitol/chloroaromatic compound transport system substrate-binding protein